MATITEDYVSFEIAKLLKEKRFDEKCRTYYKVFPKDRIAAIYHSSEDRGVSEDDPNEILCPTLQMAMKWLREVHNLFIEIQCYGCEADEKAHFEYSYVISEYVKFNTGICITFGLEERNAKSKFPSYEEACETAIRYCLEHLI